jgi:GT2 family glycosyltransferase
MSNGNKNTNIIQPSIVVIVLNYNSVQDTIECIMSLKRCKYPNLDIMVVDNGSGDGSEIIIRNKYQDVNIVQTGRNLGFCGGNNFGMNIAIKQNPKYILLLNNDTIVEPNFLEPMVNAMECDEKAAAAGGTICYYPDKQKIWYAGGRFSFWRASSLSNYSGKCVDRIGNLGKQKVTFITGCMMLVRTKVLSSVGLLDENFFMYFEDAEFSLRMIKAGFHLIYVPESRIYHKIHDRSSQLSPMYFTVRNRLLLINIATYGLHRIIAKIYFFASFILKMIYFKMRKPKLYLAALYGFEDYRKKFFYEGRGLLLNNKI